MTTLREAAQQALEALEMCRLNGSQYLYGNERDLVCSAIKALRDALAQQAEPTEETTMPITDDHGKALLPQYRVIEQHGNWRLLYDQLQSGEAVRHEFRIQKLRHDVALYPGISLAEAQKRFRERVEADNE